jgi:hypothetical protein
MWSGFGVKNNSSSLRWAETTWLFLLLFLFGTAGEVFGAAPILRSSDLSPFGGIHRLVVVFPGDRRREEAFLDQWDPTPIHTQMVHRSLLVFQVVNPKVIQELRKSMASSESGFRVWLVGMDGHLLFSTGDDVEPWEIFIRIDALPGRIAEIHRHNEWEAGHLTSH